MRIENYDLEVFTPPCDPGAERFAAKAHLNRTWERKGEMTPDYETRQRPTPPPE
jgi:hypothetical protein